MTEEEITQLDRCSECLNMFVDGKKFCIIGWIASGQNITVEDEVRHNYDAGFLCSVCYSYRISQLSQKSTRL